MKDTYVSGSTVSSVGADGSTISVDQVAHTMSLDGNSVILTQDAADSLYNILMRMYVAEQQAAYVSSNGVSGGGVPYHSIDPRRGAGGLLPGDPGCPDYVLICSSSIGGGGMLAQGHRLALNDGPISTATVSSSPASRTLGYDPRFSCTDISRALYKEMPTFRAAKLAIHAALAERGALMFQWAKELPQVPGDPTTYFGWARLVGGAVVLDAAFVAFEESRIKLNFYATLFWGQNCMHGDYPTNPPGGGGNTASACYVLVYYWEDTGEVYDEQPLGCW